MSLEYIYSARGHSCSPADEKERAGQIHLSLKVKSSSTKARIIMKMNTIWFFYNLEDFVTYTNLLLRASQPKLRHSGLYWVCKSRHFCEPDFAPILQRPIGLRERSLFGISMHILKNIFQAKTKSPHLHFVESFTHLQRAALNIAGVFGLFKSTGHMEIAV